MLLRATRIRNRVNDDVDKNDASTFETSRPLPAVPTFGIRTHPRFFSTRTWVGPAGRRRAPGCRCSTCNIMRRLAAARQSVTSWICRASWSCCRSAACPWWASRSASCLPAARRRAARSPATRPCATTVIATAICRTWSAGSGTGSGSTPPRRTATFPEGTRCAPRPRDRRRL